MREESTIRIAMWSGPRNLSTALMRAWENRPDTFVADEPFYAYYLKRTAVDHPGRDEILHHHESDWQKVVSDLTSRVRPGKTIYYQKHMSHHLLPEIDGDWLDRLTHCFLIRDPREVVLSYVETRPAVTIDDIGVKQQAQLFRREQERTGRTPPVIDARDLLGDPRGMLARLCEGIGVPFSERMLAWPAGPRDSDGVWSKHWYAAVERSTGFQPWRPIDRPLPAGLADLVAEAGSFYRVLHDHRLGR